ncbi:MAG: hypothetical protein Q9173_002431, partial [Seirophora scorigena]
TTISDLVQISPEDFQKPSIESIEDNINAKYANKQNDPSLRYTVALDFFDEIFVPGGLLFPGSSFNMQEQCWVWSNEGQEYFYDKSEWVRFRVEQEHWTDLSPIAPSEEETTGVLERKSPYTITLDLCFMPDQQAREHTLVCSAERTVERSTESLPKAVRRIAMGLETMRPHPSTDSIQYLPTPKCPINARHGAESKIGRLFEDIIRYRAGDEKREDQDIQDELDARMVALVLKRRKSLRRTRRDIDRELLLFKTLSSDSPGATVASACFGEFVALRLTYEREGEWLHYVKTYRRLVTEVGKKAVKEIEPLFASGLSRSNYDVSKSANGLEKKAAALQWGFTCIKVSDEDLPWVQP